ncbi:hypothetical protein ACRAWD_21830 [Caulobacter segnis]
MSNILAFGPLAGSALGVVLVAALVAMSGMIRYIGNNRAAGGREAVVGQGLDRGRPDRAEGRGWLPARRPRGGLHFFFLFQYRLAYPVAGDHAAGAGSAMRSPVTAHRWRPTRPWPPIRRTSTSRTPAAFLEHGGRMAAAQDPARGRLRHQPSSSSWSSPATTPSPLSLTGPRKAFGADGRGHRRARRPSPW